MIARQRDVVLPPPVAPAAAGAGAMHVAAIGIDGYRSWPQLRNAVRDAQGALNAFTRLGFGTVRSLYDDDATHEAIGRLTDELRTLAPHDSLVLFFAGHGHTVPTRFDDGTIVKTGYLMPVDADQRQTTRWLALAAWLGEIARLPPRHILVVLDACHSGIALDPIVRWRGEVGKLPDPLERLRERRSRRIITSALDDQLARDDGPRTGHSLFTGCLLEALEGGIASEGDGIITGTELGAYVRRRVATYPGSQQTPDFGSLDHDNRGELIIPLVASSVFGSAAALASSSTRSRRALAKGGAKAAGKRNGKTPAGRGRKRRLARGSAAAIPANEPGLRPSRQPAAAASDRKRTRTLAGRSRPAIQANDRADTRRLLEVSGLAIQTNDRAGTQRLSDGSGLAMQANDHAGTRRLPGRSGRAIQASDRAGTRKIPDGSSRTIEANDRGGTRRPARSSEAAAPVIGRATATMLDRHDAERAGGQPVLTVLTGEPIESSHAWASWAAHRGYLTLVTECETADRAIPDLLGQVPLLRCAAAARARLAVLAEVDEGAIDAMLDARSSRERTAWLDDVAGHDIAARVGGWLLASLREAVGSVPDLASAPVAGSRLLVALCELSAPIAVLVHHAKATAAWLERAIGTAAALATLLPARNAVAVAAPTTIATGVLAAGRSAALSMARQGVVAVETAKAKPQPHARSNAEQRLYDALARDRRTAGHFELNVPVPIHEQERTLEVDLVATAALLAVEIDGWYHFREPDGYRRDRVKDVWLQRAGFFVMRFLADDVEDRLELVVDQIAVGLASRRTCGLFEEGSDDERA